MAIKYPDSYCEESPIRAHYWKVVAGSVWQCKYCWEAKWLPLSWEDAIRFTSDISKHGRVMAYKKWVNNRPKTKQLLEKLEEIRLLRKVLPPDELMMAIAAIMTDTKFRSTPDDETVIGNLSVLASVSRWGSF